MFDLITPAGRIDQKAVDREIKKVPASYSSALVRDWAAKIRRAAIEQLSAFEKKFPNRPTNNIDCWAFIVADCQPVAYDCADRSVSVLGDRYYAPADVAVMLISGDIDGDCDTILAAAEDEPLRDVTKQIARFVYEYMDATGKLIGDDCEFDGSKFLRNFLERNGCEDDIAEEERLARVEAASIERADREVAEMHRWRTR